MPKQKRKRAIGSILLIGPLHFVLVDGFSREPGFSVDMVTSFPTWEHDGTLPSHNILPIPKDNTEKDIRFGSIRPQTPLTVSHNLPVWLHEATNPALQENMSRLRTSMLESAYTESQIQTVNEAIEEAANFHPRRMAQAAEFCRLLVEIMGTGVDTVVSAAFHYCDVVEPCEHRLHSSIGSRFGEEVAKIQQDTDHLAKLDSVASTMRFDATHRVTPDLEEFSRNLRDLYVSESQDWRSLAIRCAVCLLRLQQQPPQISVESSRLAREALDVYAPIASRMGMGRLKDVLEESAFRLLYPRQHKTVSDMFHHTVHHDMCCSCAASRPDRQSTDLELRLDMANNLNHIQDEVKKLLENDPTFSANTASFSVSVRIKQSYSTWKKLLRNHCHDIHEIPDVFALRIVLNAKRMPESEAEEVTRDRDEALCYYTQQLCMKELAPHESGMRFKDYISHPKPNGYKSLHYTAAIDWHGERRSMEVQVRSGEMHRIAEFGIASHWDYKERKKLSKLRKRGSEWGQTENCPENRVISHAPILVQHPSYRFGNCSDPSRVHCLQTKDGLLEIPSTCQQSTETGGHDPEKHWGSTKAQQVIGPYIAALIARRSILAHENLFVFLRGQEPKGSRERNALITLPAGSVVWDAMKYCGLSVDSLGLIAHNGACPKSLSTELRNGDLISIGTPIGRDWWSFTATTKSK